MTNQEIFNRAWLHAISMTDLAVESDQDNRRPVCRYRTSNGNRCLIGYFIPDEKYSPNMENKKVSDLCTTDEFMNVFSDIGLFDGTDNRLKFLWAIQQSHDSWDVTTVEKMLVNLRYVAFTYNLTVPE